MFRSGKKGRVPGETTECSRPSPTVAMKAIVYHNYGSPDVLRCEEIEKPTVGDDEVLIKVRAASINPLDCHFIRGMPYPVRIMSGLRRPNITRPLCGSEHRQECLAGVPVPHEFGRLGVNLSRKHVPQNDTSHIFCDAYKSSLPQTAPRRHRSFRYSNKGIPKKSPTLPELRYPCFL
jgi:hypothetical protein